MSGYCADCGNTLCICDVMAETTTELRPLAMWGWRLRLAWFVFSHGLPASAEYPDGTRYVWAAAPSADTTEDTP